MANLPRTLTALALALPCWLLTPTAYAQSSPQSSPQSCGDGECYTARQAQTCLVCLRERPKLREAARNCEAAQNVTAGRLGECRDQTTAYRAERDQLRLDLHDTRQALGDAPGWAWVAGSTAGGIIAGGLTVLLLGL